MLAQSSTPARNMVRQLLETEIADATDPTSTTTALQRLLSRVLGNLRSALGDDGHNALLARALSRTKTEYPFLADTKITGPPRVTPESIAEIVDSHGASVVTAAISSLLATLIDLLSGLIGADMVLNLIDPDARSSTNSTAGNHNDPA